MAVTPEDLTSKTNNNLSTALGTTPTPLPIPSTFGKEAKGYMETMQPLMKESAQAEGELKKFEYETQAKTAKNKARTEREYIQNVQNLNKSSEEKEAEFPRPEFHPTQENALSLGSLFSLVSTIGLLVGASGKQSAGNAMNAMTGMLKGWQTGRKDLYEKELKEFDKEYKRITDVRNEIQKKLEKSIQLQTSDKEASFLELESARALADSNSVLGLTIRNRGAQGALELLKGSYKLQSDIDAIKAKKDEAQASRDLRLQIAELRSGGGGGAGAKITAKAVEGYRSRLILNEDLNELKRDLSDPEMVNLLKKYRIEAFLTEEGKALNQVINSEIPDKLQTFLTKVRDIRNNYYLDISGKAVTGGEALRSYGTVPQPGDDARNMLNKIDGMQKRVGNQISFDQQLYQFPNIKISGGQPTGLVPNEVYKSGDSGYQVGQIIPKGNKKYRIVNIDDPSNPEIEEVK
jgi:hypothetical protein